MEVLGCVLLQKWASIYIWYSVPNDRVKAISCVVQTEVSLLFFEGQFYFFCYNECYPLQLLNLQCSEQGGLSLIPL